MNFTFFLLVALIAFPFPGMAKTWKQICENDPLNLDKLMTLDKHIKALEVAECGQVGIAEKPGFEFVAAFLCDGVDFSGGEFFLGDDFDGDGVFFVEFEKGAVDLVAGAGPMEREGVGKAFFEFVAGEWLP